MTKIDHDRPELRLKDNWGREQALAARRVFPEGGVERLKSLLAYNRKRQPYHLKRFAEFSENEQASLYEVIHAYKEAIENRATYDDRLGAKDKARALRLIDKADRRVISEGCSLLHFVLEDTNRRVRAWHWLLRYCQKLDRRSTRVGVNLEDILINKSLPRYLEWADVEGTTEDMRSLESFIEEVL